jgi:hypothetical protein
LGRKGQSFNWDASGHSAILAMIGHSSLGDPDALGATPVDYKEYQSLFEILQFLSIHQNINGQNWHSHKISYQLPKP